MTLFPENPDIKYIWGRVNNMSSQQILQHPKVVTHQNFHEVTTNEVKQQSTKPDDLNIPDLVVSLTPLGFIVSWAIFLVILRKIRTNLDNKRVFSIDTLHKVPCKNCQYYSNNHYLKCAVQPHIVLSEEAVNCSEYSPKKRKFNLKNLFR